MSTAVPPPAISAARTGPITKDARYPLIDYLDPNATRAFMSTTHDVCKQLFGDQFGSTVLGFFGDEPDYAASIPWTPALLDEFRKQKGYDLQAYIPLFFARELTDEAKRVKADYYDVWSGIFQNSFFGVQADWCAKNNLEYLVHLVGEDETPASCPQPLLVVTAILLDTRTAGG